VLVERDEGQRESTDPRIAMGPHARVTFPTVGLAQRTRGRTIWARPQKTRRGRTCLHLARHPCLLALWQSAAHDRPATRRWGGVGGKKAVLKVGECKGRVGWEGEVWYRGRRHNRSSFIKLHQMARECGGGAPRNPEGRGFSSGALFYSSFIDFLFFPFPIFTQLCDFFVFPSLLLLLLLFLFGIFNGWPSMAYDLVLLLSARRVRSCDNLREN
jgi:hypothetical protein